MKFSISDQLTHGSHLVTVEAWSDGKTKPKALAKLTGFGDSLHRDISFSEKDLQSGLEALQAADTLVKSVQKIADKWFKEIQS